MSWRYGFAPYVPVAVRRAQAQKKITKISKGGTNLCPVQLSGKAIATTFWGKAWCQNLESYSDYSNRLPRGRTYLRNGSVIDLQIGKGEIKAQIVGSDHYHGLIKISPLPAEAWARIKKECAGKIESVIELLQGKLSQSVMEVIIRRDGGLFPKPSEIKLDCSCPDWADLCKHLAAVLYGVGVRLDDRPELLFLLRGVDQTELITLATSTTITEGKSDSTLDANLSEVFGIEIVEESKISPPTAKSKGSGLVKTAKLKPIKAVASKKKKMSAKNSKVPKKK